MKNKYLKYVFPVMIIAGDVILASISLYLAYNLRFNSALKEIFPVIKEAPPWPPYQQLLYIFIILFSVTSASYKFFRYSIISAIDELILIIKSVAIVTVIIMAITFIYREYEYSRLVIGINTIILTLFVFLWHEANRLIYRLIMISGVGNQEVAIIGEVEQVEQFRKTIRKYRHFHPHFIVEKKDEESLIDFITKKNIREVFMTTSYFDPQRLLVFSYKCEQLEIDFKMIPTVLHILQGQIHVDESLSIPVFHIKPLSLYGINFFLKRIFDLIAAIILSSILLLPLLIVAILIKIDSPGPVFYKNKRLGHKGRSFDFFKFRTMVINADEILEKIKHLTDRNGPVFKMKNDPRITGIGKVLRRFSIDELPQLLNVLKGNMSLVGPRPQPLWEAAAYDELAKRRLRVLPGITGLWQVSGRASLSYEEMIKLDMYYIENWTLGLDVKIIFKTLLVIFSKHGAY